MKYLPILTLFLAFIWATPSFSQSRKINFVEHFSNTKCPNCQSSRAGIYTDLAKYKGEINHMTIHQKYPYSTCPLYEYNKTEAENRVAIYAGSTQPLPYTPTLYVNSKPGHYNSLAKNLDDAMGQKEVSVGLNMVEKGTKSKEVTLDIFNLTGAVMDNLYVYAALVQKVVKVNVDKKDWEIHDVFRMFLGDQKGKGDAVGTLKAGETTKIKLEGQVPNDLQPSDLYIVAWVEQRIPEGDSYKIIMHNSVSVSTNTITGTELQIPDSELSIYPNPGHDLLRVANTSEFTPHHYRILSGSGQEIKRMTASGSINISDLPPGQYYLILENDNSRVNRKFIKQ